MGWSRQQKDKLLKQARSRSQYRRLMRQFDKKRMLNETLEEEYDRLLEETRNEWDRNDFGGIEGEDQ